MEKRGNYSAASAAAEFSRVFQGPVPGQAYFASRERRLKSDSLQSSLTRRGICQLALQAINDLPKFSRPYGTKGWVITKRECF